MFQSLRSLVAGCTVALAVLAPVSGRGTAEAGPAPQTHHHAHTPQRPASSHARHTVYYRRSVHTGWVLHGTYNQRADAAHAIQMLRGRGYETFTQQSGHTSSTCSSSSSASSSGHARVHTVYYRTCVHDNWRIYGSYRDYNAAATAANGLRLAGYEPFVR